MPRVEAYDILSVLRTQFKLVSSEDYILDNMLLIRLIILLGYHVNTEMIE